MLCENHHIQLKSEVMGLLWALKAEKDETFRRRPKNAREAMKRTAFLIEEAKYRQKWSHKIRQLTEEFLECREGEVRKMVPSGYTK
ncbi:hypothetical protein AKJ53_01155 [candidate division MSBL1 archaeon SCGC-AAA382F02]|uniref:Transposase n=1 Tax=candidate division MSBL1 archaeon SCGC-AAA382F02 TaxID=1698282 RepID=A0A133VID3_9EURY|nr:hypothetical protein AKJ53_01155 [candidate division MSBL1 archaeon SCGC-AAA382F02]